MIYRYTCSGCGILVRVDQKGTGRDIVACLCDVPIIEEEETE
jgi:hypothetical protein